ncbi:MAG: ABC transporter permease [Methanobacteriota archaeon]|nr:MAG: ABC transporter permease [Euryarchaeota archaeon]
MRLRTYLIRRAIHTVITLLVVLVLLFVIFRLMPGDPTRFFIAPGQPPQVRDEICVSFGLCKWVSAPGNGYQGQIQAGADGAYNVTAFVNDTAGTRCGANPCNYTFVYNNFPLERDQRNGHPGVVVTEVTLAKAGGIARPSLPDAAPGDTITVRAKIVIDSMPASSLRVLKPDNVTWIFLGAPQTDSTPRYFYWTFVAPDRGTYWGVITARNATLTENFTFGFAASPPVPGFDLVEGKFYGIRPSFPQNVAVLSVNVTARAAPIRNVTANLVSPGGFPQVDIHLRHPLQVARRSLAEQFVLYFINMLSGNFGNSFYTKRPVMDEISVRIGPTLLLFGSAVVISYLLGVLLGAILAWRRGSKMELSAIVVSLFFYSMPVFWFGLVLLWFFAFDRRWFPLGGIGGFDPKTGLALNGFALVGDILWHMALPLGNLVILGLAGHVLLMRNSMLEVMGEDYILTAKAKGLSERRIMYRHAARNALLPVVTALAISIGGVISGGVLTETIFSWPGMGFYLVAATLQQDYPSVQAAFFILAVLTILANTVADVLYAYLDPRVRL